MDAWMNQTWWLYDATVVAILVLCIWNGWRRGFIGSIVGLSGYGIALLLAWGLAQPTAEWAYNRWLKEPCINILEQKLEQYQLASNIQQALSAYSVQLDSESLRQIADHPDSAEEQLYAEISGKTGISAEVLQQGLSQSIDNAAAQMFTEIPNWMSEAIVSDGNAQQTRNRVIQSAALVLSGDNRTAAKELTETYIHPVLLKIVKTFAFSVLFLLISFLIQGIIKISAAIRCTNSGHIADRTLGSIVGVAQGVFLLVLMGKLTEWIVQHSDSQTAFFNPTVIARSVLFQYFYQWIR